MFNALELIRSNPAAKTFEIGELLFAQFGCPGQDENICIWSSMDHLLHVVTATASWKTRGGTFCAEAGQTVFFKKGAYILPHHTEEDLCVELFFIPDALVRQTVMELADYLHAISHTADAQDQVIWVDHDVGLSAFLHSMNVYFSAKEKPSVALLNLKLKELLTSILVGQSNPALSAYFRSIAANDAPSIRSIMEESFCHNLPLEVFAQMCHRSLSSFNRDFRKHYGITPGKWLQERRLLHSLSLLQNTKMSITEIMIECGFQDLSHFSRAFKSRFGSSPNSYRLTLSITV